MDSDYVQNIRQAWGFLQENEITKGILDDLERRFPTSEQMPTKRLRENHRLERPRARTMQLATGL
jgi:hypothetical protein